MPAVHEFSTPMRVKYSPDQINPEHVEPGTLRVYHFISLERLSASHRLSYRKSDGDPVLKAIASLSARTPRPIVRSEVIVPPVWTVEPKRHGRHSVASLQIIFQEFFDEFAEPRASCYRTKSRPS